MDSTSTTFYLEVRLQATYMRMRAREKFFDGFFQDSAPFRYSGFRCVTYLPTRLDWNDPFYLEGTPREGRHPVDNRSPVPGYFPRDEHCIRDGAAFEEATRGASLCSPAIGEKRPKLLWPSGSTPWGGS